MGIIIDATAGAVLLAKRDSKTRAYPNMWSIPGGFLEAEVESLEESISREILEEVGLLVEPEDWVMLGVESEPGVDPRGHNICAVYAYVLREGQKTDHLEADDDIVDIRWVPYDDIRSMRLAFNHTRILEKYNIV